MAWRSLLAQGLQTDIERKRANPGIANFRAILQSAMAMKGQKAQEAREEARGARNVARTALYQARPEMAAEALGMELPTREAPTAPPGTDLSKVVYDEQGNPTYTFEPPSDTTTKPSWGQEQKVQALKTGLRTGKVVIGREFGMPSQYPSGKKTMNMEQALLAIQDAGLSPELFMEELKLYDVVEERTFTRGPHKGKTLQKLRDGRVIWADTKQIAE